MTGGIVVSEAAAVFESAGAAGELTGFTRHGLNRVIQRGVKPGDIFNALRNGESITEFDKLGRISFRFVGEKATVILNRAGKIITAWLQGW